MTVVAFDKRGEGKSSRPNDPYTIDTLVDDIKDLLEYLDIQEQIHLCGFSSGCSIAQLFVLKYPALVKTLILLGAASYLPDIEYKQQLKALEEIHKNATPEDINKITLTNMFSLSFRKKIRRDKELLELYRNDMGLVSQLKDPPRYQDYVNQWKTLKGFDTRELLHTITQPTLMMVGSKDVGNLGESKAMLEKIPNSIIEIFEDAGHGIIIEAPEKTNNFMWNFLKEHLNLKTSM